MTSSATGRDSRPPGGDGAPADVDGAVRALAQADPQSFYDAAQRFDRTAVRLRTVSADFRGRLRHLEQAWQGEGFEAFSAAAEKLLRRIDHSVDALVEPSYANLLTELGDALAEAKRDVEDVRAQRESASSAPDADPQAARAEQDARAQEVLRRLGSTYSSVGGRFRAPPENPALHRGDRTTARAARASHVAGTTGGAASAAVRPAGAAADGAASADGAQHGDERGGAALGAAGQQHAAQPDQSATGVAMPVEDVEGAGSIWSSVLPTSALPAAAVIGREKRKRDEKKRRRDEDQNASEQDEHDSEESQDDSGKEHDSQERRSEGSGAESHHRKSSHRHGDAHEHGATGDEDDDSREQGHSGDDSGRHSHGHHRKAERGHGDQDDADRTFHTESTEDDDAGASAAAQDAVADPGPERIPDTTSVPAPAAPPSAPPAPAVAAGPPAAAAAGGGASALRAHLGAPVSTGGVASAPPTGVRSDAGTLSVPSEPSASPTAQPSTVSGQAAGTAPQSGMPPMNPRTMGGQPNQQETGHQERDRNVAQREDPGTWQVGAGSAGALGRESREEGESR